MNTQDILVRAKQACSSAALLTSQDKNRALDVLATSLIEGCAYVLEQNALDVEAAKEKLSASMIDRLFLDESRIAAMAEGIKQVAALDDPVGRCLASHQTANGLLIQKISVALGVVAIIYESRPNVTSDAAALCLKSGNVCVLRSGKEAYRSAAALVDVMRAGLQKAGFDPDLINIVNDITRASANELMTANGLVDLLIPRGGAGLINACVTQATVPCIQTGTGICHVYVDESADQDMALSIIENAKTSRPSVCNAEEVLLVNSNIAAEFLPKLQQRLCTSQAAHAVELRCDTTAAAILNLEPAGPEAFDTEFLDYILAVGVVADVKEAIAHIGAHSTHHSDAIITRNQEAAALFTRQVDSAAVYVNASTRFTDGGEFGLGCEMGISTQKLHARGPMGLAELTTYKYVIQGDGQIRV